MERETLNLTWEERLALLEEQKEFYDNGPEQFRIKALPFEVALDSLNDIGDIKEEDLKGFVAAFIQAMVEKDLELTDDQDDFYKGGIGAVCGIIMNDKIVIEAVRKLMKDIRALDEIKEKILGTPQENKEEEISAIKAEIKFYFDKNKENDKREQGND